MSSSSYWQLVFNQSRVNGAEYFGDRLPCNSWDWPKDTFLQKRLSELKKRPRSVSAQTAQVKRESIPSNRKRRNIRHDEPVWLQTTGTALRVDEH